MLACRLHIWMTVLSTSRSLPSCSVRAVAGAAGVTNKLGDLNHHYLVFFTCKNCISGLLCGHLLMAAVLTVSLVLLMFQLDMEGDRKCEAW